MPASLIICDDSNLARKQLARSLPDNFDMEIHFAANGIEAVDALRKGLGDIMFLDLNMPEMDGYEVLQAIRDEDLNSMVIVVSGDIQPEARKRVKALGAVEFIKKPIDIERLQEVMLDYGLVDEIIKQPAQSKATSKPKQKSATKQISSALQDKNFHVNFLDCYQEITNVGMGQAADLLAKMLGVFVSLPVPNVNIIEVSEIHMALTLADDEKASAVCQGFIGRGIAGEAILIFNDAGIECIAKLMDHKGEIDDCIERELVMDISNILIGACLNGIGKQLNINFSQGHPLILGQHKRVSSMIKANTNRWKKTLAIEVNYTISNADITCDLLLLFTEDSLETLNSLVSYLLDDE
ncbi:MAG: response regulator [Gammaproteobacteria bacterium]|nr:MAG: response regulator [Gammaproteobacteria bacterium]